MLEKIRENKTYKAKLLISKTRLRHKIYYQQSGKQNLLFENQRSFFGIVRIYNEWQPNFTI